MNYSQKPEFKIKKVAAYCRVSRNLEIQQSSIDTQVEAYKRIISEHPGWILAGIYADRGVTGTSATRRKEFQRMIEDCRQGKIDMILAKSISRFARNTEDALKYSRLLRDLGVGIYFEKEKIDTSKQMSELLLTVFAAFAQEESISISENIKRGFRQRFEMGIPKYGNTYGYTPNPENREEWQVVPDEAEAVKKIFYGVLDGKTNSEICRELTDGGYKPPRGEKWHSSEISRVCANEKYIGEVVIQKYYVGNPLEHKVLKNDQGAKPSFLLTEHHEPLVDSYTRDMANHILFLKNNKKGTSQYPYYDFLKCPRCGKQMVSYNMNDSCASKAWVCTDAKNCGAYAVKEKYITDILYGIIQDSDDFALSELKEALQKNNRLGLHLLNKYVEKIELPNFDSVKITFRTGDVKERKIEFQRPSENPNLELKKIGEKYYFNGESEDKNNIKQCIRAVLRIREDILGIELIEPTDEDPIYRASNRKKGKSWERWREAEKKEKMGNENNEN